MEKQQLPQKLIRQCCVGKSCGSTKLYLYQGWGPDGELYEYRRESNDDTYWGPFDKSTMTEYVDNPKYLSEDS